LRKSELLWSLFTAEQQFVGQQLLSRIELRWDSWY